MNLIPLKIVVLLGSIFASNQAIAVDFISQVSAVENEYEQRGYYRYPNKELESGTAISASVSLDIKIKSTPKALASENSSQTKVDQFITGSTKSDVFKSVAIPFFGISSQPKWQKALSALENLNSFTCSGSLQCEENKTKISTLLEKSKNLKFSEKLNVVNREINDLITYQSDQSIYNNADYWALPKESISRGQGDCEDYVILKLALLKKLGIPTRSMSMVVLKDMERNLFHAVLAVSTNKGAFILDNVYSSVLLDRQLPHYLPLYSFSENRSWIHGRRITDDRYLASSDTDYQFSKIHPGESSISKQLVLPGVSKIELVELRPTALN